MGGAPLDYGFTQSICGWTGAHTRSHRQALSGQRVAGRRVTRADVRGNNRRTSTALTPACPIRRCPHMLIQHHPLFFCSANAMGKITRLRLDRCRLATVDSPLMSVSPLASPERPCPALPDRLRHTLLTLAARTPCDGPLRFLSDRRIVPLKPSVRDKLTSALCAQTWPLVTHVFLQHNRLESLAPLGALAALQFLSASHNRLARLDGISGAERNRPAKPSLGAGVRFTHALRSSRRSADAFLSTPAATAAMTSDCRPRLPPVP